MNRQGVGINCGLSEPVLWRNFDLGKMELEKFFRTMRWNLSMASNLGELRCGKSEIKAVFQIQEYAFYGTVIENGNSWVFKSLLVRWQFLGVGYPPEDLNVWFWRSFPLNGILMWCLMNKPDFETIVYAFLSTQPQGSQLVHEDLEQIHDDDLEEIDLKWNMALLSMRARKAPRSKDNRNWNQGSSSKAVKIEDASEKAMCAIDGAGFDWSDMAEDEIQANMALMAFTDSEVSIDKSCSKSCLNNYEALKKQYDDLLVKLDDTGFKAATYKRGLSILEAQVVKYKESEVLFSEEIALLKRSVGHKEYLMGLLKTELEKVKEEKEGFEFKIAKFEKSSKDLDDLLASQVTDKSKKGFGYNVVPSPHPLILNRPTPLDLSYSGLEEFKQPEVNEYGPRDSSLKPTTGCDKESDNSKENTDDSLKQQHKTVTETSSVKSPLKVDKDWKEKFFYPANHVREEEPKKARENNDAPIIEDWVSDDEEEVEPIPKVEKKTAIPTATKKESVKPEKPIRRSVRSVNTGRPFSTARSFNTVRPSYTANSKSTSNCARPKTYFQNQAQSTAHRPFYKRTTLTNRCVNQRFNTGRPFRSSVNTVRAKGMKQK
ncbi:hypothetical protein Tco_0157803 [Tanacetum coccineum]